MQVEIATLAAGGKTSREIAEERAISVRTVENHLQRAYESLRVSTRAELRTELDKLSIIIGDASR